MIAQDEAILEPVIRYFRFKKGIKMIPKKKSIVLADLGCGPKIRFYHFATRSDVKVKKYFGVDPLLENSLVEKYKKHKTIKLVNSPLKSKINLKNDSIDCLVGFAFIEHVDNPSKLLIDSIRFLKKGGIAIFTTPTKKSQRLLEFLSFQLRLVSKREIEEHKNYFDEKSLKYLLKREKNIEVIHEYFELGMNNLLLILKK